MDDVAPDPATRQPLREVVARDIRRKIMAGELAPGDRLREQALATEYGVSRVPAREALHVLAQEGFVDTVPRRGATVAFPSAQRTRQLMVIRENLEVLAAGLAARRRGGDQGEELTEVLELGTRATATGDYAALPELIARFHDAVGIASGNDELAKMTRSLRMQVRWVFEMQLEERSGQSWKHHQEIAEAILAGDQERAESSMHADVTRDADLLVDLLVARAERQRP
jgi:DNA-binding GntR family transcriptional regulator